LPLTPPGAIDFVPDKAIIIRIVGAINSIIPRICRSYWQQWLMVGFGYVADLKIIFLFLLYIEEISM
jgi:hypothetical protein